MPINFKQLADLLGPDGPLNKWGAYEARKEQLDMALEVAKAFNDGSLALIEAGTGTGKTLAYILPALLSRKKTVISTGLINLQDQIFYKDLKFIKKYFNANFLAVLVKGRDNYLCFMRYNALIRRQGRTDLLRTARQKEYLHDLTKWVETTATGEIIEMPDPLPKFFSKGTLGAVPEICKKPAECPFAEKCFWMRVKRQAQSADLILVNHHLFMADISIRLESANAVLPEWDAAILDEGHMAEDVATSWFGDSLQSWEVMQVAKNIVSLFETTPNLANLLDTALLFENTLENLPELFKDVESESELFPEDGDKENQKSIRQALESIKEMAITLIGLIPVLPHEHDDLEFEVLKSKLNRTAETAVKLLEAADPTCVYQIEKRSNGVELSVLPINGGEILGKALLDSKKPVVITSATLSSYGDFEFLKKRLALPPKTASLSLPSPYDYKNATLLYVPKHFPVPGEGDFFEAYITDVKRILKLSVGRALLLFTSIGMMKKTAKTLKDLLPWTLYVQGEQSRTVLLEKFKKDVSSVLLATLSFWQGVDVPGESLSVVIIDKLPFTRPNQPLFQARKKLIESQGGNGFTQFALPTMTLTLKQGLGRLLRSRTDTGLLAVMDKRLVDTWYGKQVLKSLPPSPLATSFEPVEAFLKKISPRAASRS
ncbi:MAG: ATP-dependent DNA helicase [Deltaproteobacteria bacterium]|jgi:ATP-dependent DNA helicase DinG|nr:ATP-dependent DNA helicase [Deltaproteobacteria bacterium]